MDHQTAEMKAGSREIRSAHLMAEPKVQRKVGLMAGS